MATEWTTIQRIDPFVDPFSLIQSASRLGDATKKKYIRVMSEFLEQGGDLGDPVALAQFAATLSQSRRAHLKAAVGRWSKAMTTIVKGQATPENVDAVAASVMRFEALTEAIEVQAQKGDKTHIWLSKAQVKRLSNAVGNGIQGARDRAMLGLLVAAGLRREEAVSLTFDDIKPVPNGERMRTVLAIKGKGARARTVPVSDKLAGDLRAWGEFVGHQGRVCRSLGRLKEPGESMSAVGLFKLVRKYAARIKDIPDTLAPHDLRRTYARIAYQDGVDIGQISKLLGHESIKTTQRYLGISVNIEVTASDFIPW